MQSTSPGQPLTTRLLVLTAPRQTAGTASRAGTARPRDSRAAAAAAPPLRSWRPWLRGHPMGQRTGRPGKNVDF